MTCNECVTDYTKDYGVMQEFARISYPSGSRTSSFNFIRLEICVETALFANALSYAYNEIEMRYKLEDGVTCEEGYYK